VKIKVLFINKNYKIQAKRIIRSADSKICHRILIIKILIVEEITINKQIKMQNFNKY
jgi:hypothetical protein